MKKLKTLTKLLDCGVVAVGVGGNLVTPAKKGDFDKVTEMARLYVEKIQAAREE